MFWYILLAVVIILMIVLVCILDNDFDIIGFGFPIIVLIFLISFVSHIVVTLNYTSSDEVKLSDTQEIYCLNDNRDVEGKFFLASGTVDTESYYYYMYKADEGLISGKVPSDNAYINEFEDDTQTPRIETYVREESLNETLCFWFAYKVPEKLTQEKVAYYKVYIPEGSITSDYNIDLN